MTTENELTEQKNKISLDQLFFDWTQSNKQIRERIETREMSALEYENIKTAFIAAFELGKNGQGERVEALEAKIDELFVTINDCFVEVGSIGHKASRVVKKLNEAASMPLPEPPGE